MSVKFFIRLHEPQNIVSKISVEVFQHHLPHSFFVKSIPEAKKFHWVNLQREKAQILIDL